MYYFQNKTTTLIITRNVRLSFILQKKLSIYTDANIYARH